MTRLFWIASLLGCVLMNTQISAATFKTEKLRKAVEILGMRNYIDSLPLNQMTKVTTKNGQPIGIRINSTKEVEHVGIPLFNENMRLLMPSPVYDFLEFATLNWKYKVNPNTLYLTKILFRKGNWESLIKDGLDACDCSIENIDDKLYVVTWKRDSQDIAVVGIPIEYELLSNDSRRNIEKDFIRQLQNHRCFDGKKVHKAVCEDELKIYGTEGLFVIQGESYILPQLNQNIYYTLKTIRQEMDTVMYNKLTTLVFEEVVPTIVIDEEHPNESFANLLMCNDLTVPDVNIKLDFHLSDYHRHQILMPLSQLKDFFLQEGCKLFFASSGVVHDSKTVHGIIFAHNAAKGYNHLLSLTIPISKLTDSIPEMQASAYLFIPPIDKSHLFGKTPEKKSGAKIRQHL